MAIKIYLKEWQDIRGLTMLQLAARADVAPTVLARILHDNHNWNSELLEKLAEALAVEPVDLLRSPPR